MRGRSEQLADTAAPRPADLAPPTSTTTDDILAAGAVVWRSSPAPEASAGRVEGAPATIAPQSPGSPAPEASAGRVEGSRLTIAVIHRPRYGDWSLPKGKLDAGESMPAAAVREVREETGVVVRLGPWLGDVRYAVADGHKLVRYWAAQACAATEFVPNQEVDELRWVSPDAARELLSYAHDVEVVNRFADLGPTTGLLLLVRHAKAGSRDSWDGEDRLRPLSGSGHKQARELAELLRLFGPDRIVTAPLVRCRDTVRPLAEALGLPIEDEPLLGEEAYGDDPAATLRRVCALAALPGVTVVSSQGEVIPAVVAQLARAAARTVAVDPDDVPSKKASTWVLGLRDGALISADYIERPGG